MRKFLQRIWQELCFHKTATYETEVGTMGIVLVWSFTRYREYSRCLKCGKEFVDRRIHIELS